MTPQVLGEGTAFVSEVSGVDGPGVVGRIAGCSMSRADWPDVLRCLVACWACELEEVSRRDTGDAGAGSNGEGCCCAC